MQVQRAGEPRTEDLDTPLVGVAKRCVIPVMPAPDQEWREAFKRALADAYRAPGFSVRNPDRWMEEVDVAAATSDSGYIAFLVTGEIAAKIGDALDFFERAIAVTNDHVTATQRSQEDADRQAAAQREAFDRQLHEGLERWKREHRQE